MKKRSTKKQALIISVCLLMIWSIMGTTTTLAWFTDTTPVIRNSFVIGKLKLEVSYKNDLVTDYAPVDEDTAVFNDEARYEPNYTQVVYLKVDNTGDMAFNYKVMVDEFDTVDSTSKDGGNIHLPDYLMYGVLFSDNEADLERETAQTVANLEMGLMEENFRLLGFDAHRDTVTVEPGQTRYVALIVYMPSTVGNEANHLTGETPPQVHLGLTVYAQQADTPMN